LLIKRSLSWVGKTGFLFPQISLRTKSVCVRGVWVWVWVCVCWVVVTVFRVLPTTSRESSQGLFPLPGGVSDFCAKPEGLSRPYRGGVGIWGLLPLG
jgi:hypothetical protein